MLQNEVVMRQVAAGTTTIANQSSNTKMADEWEGMIEKELCVEIRLKVARVRSQLCNWVSTDRRRHDSPLICMQLEYDYCKESFCL